MARLRTIKPGFFLDEELAECQPLARILFAGLWTIADREGRLEDRPRRIKVETLPYDECDVNALLEELAAAGFIVRYEIAGARYIAIPAWAKHQQPHYKEVASTIPAPPGAGPDTYRAEPVTAAQRERILERDGRRCVRCGSGEDLAIDHVIPRSKGGTSDDDNLQTLCRRCNSSKGNRDHASTSAQRRAEVGSTSSEDRGDVARGLRSLGSCLRSSVNGGSGGDQQAVDNSEPAPDPGDLGGSIDPDQGQVLPDLPIALCGPIRRAGGSEALTAALEDGSDLNLAVRRYAGRVLELTDGLLAHLPPAKLAEARERVLGECLRSAEKAKPTNLAAYLTTARKRSTHLGDLVGDQTVAELLELGKSRRGKK